jgi:hypothetical protein
MVIDCYEFAGLMPSSLTESLTIEYASFSSGMQETPACLRLSFLSRQRVPLIYSYCKHYEHFARIKIIGRRNEKD